MGDQKLAIDGGAAVIGTPLPTGVSGPSVIGDEEISAVTEVLKSQNLFRYPSEDSEAAKFEEEAAELLGVEYALMVNSGTSALIAALTGVGVGPGDEVIVPCSRRSVLALAAPTPASARAESSNPAK